MGILKKLGSWLVMGLFVGTGFTVAMYTVGYIAMDYYTDSAKSKFKSEISIEGKGGGSASFTSLDNIYKEYDQDAGLVVVSHKERRVGKSVDILGVIENQGNDTWGSINIEVELFDKKGGFVDECSEYIQGSIKPGEKQNFKVSCRRCDKNPLPKYEKYTIAVKNAYFKRSKK